MKNTKQNKYMKFQTMCTSNPSMDWQIKTRNQSRNTNQYQVREKNKTRNQDFYVPLIWEYLIEKISCLVNTARTTRSILKDYQREIQKGKYIYIFFSFWRSILYIKKNNKMKKSPSRMSSYPYIYVIRSPSRHTHTSML